MIRYTHENKERQRETNEREGHRGRQRKITENRWSWRETKGDNGRQSGTERDKGRQRETKGDKRDRG